MITCVYCRSVVVLVRSLPPYAGADGIMRKLWSRSIVFGETCVVD
jgi:hypothetical protein